MKRSAAPSQLNKRAKLFSPPYKAAQIPHNDVNGANSPVAPIFVQPMVEELNFQGKPIKNRSSSDILNLIKQKSSPVLEKFKSLQGLQEVSSNIICDLVENNPKKVNSQEKLIPSLNPLIDPSTLSAQAVNKIRYFSVVWCKLSKKKHKSWEGDAVLIINGRTVILKDSEGKDIGRSSSYKLKDLESLGEGNTLPVGSKEVEIQGKLLEEDYLSGKCFLENVPVAFTGEDSSTIDIKIKQTKFKPFRLPLQNAYIEGQSMQNAILYKSLFDASNPDAIVMPRPTSNHQWSHNSQSLPVTDVVIDPHLGIKLRPHQQDGIVFLYECVMGFKLKEYQGAILADEMGLGKTLQCITLIWTLLKQGPYGCIPMVKKVLIVTPSSICANWGQEFDKWLGRERIKTFIIDQQNKVHDFTKQKISSIMIISYELLVRNIEKIKSISFELLLCDEGHRLKNGNIKTSSFLSELCIKKRIIVTGTPIQNDLQELFSLVEFVNPGILGTSSMFKKIYEDCIVRSQQPNATKEEKQIGGSRASELNRITSQFTLRRTQEIINKYLPPKSEYVIFCQSSQTQSKVYQSVVGCNGLQKFLLNPELGEHLSAICMLRKLSNHPALLCSDSIEENLSEIKNEIVNLMPSNLNKNVYLEQDSGKLAVVSCILWSLSETKRERVVLVSNFTSTLNMLQQLCERYNYGFLRLDGSTPTTKRQILVDKFNRKDCTEFVFLLSSKAGGVGLNLIGASRIILFDIDWNPASDLQAMARVWRDGQRKSVYIYRLLLAGSIEEKIYQRQVCKQGISGSVVDARSHAKVKFSIEELKDLFKFYPNAECLTHETMNCHCDQIGGLQHSESPVNSQEDNRDSQLFSSSTKKNNIHNGSTMDQLYSWQHFNMSKEIETLGDPYLESARDFITFVFKCQENKLEMI